MFGDGGWPDSATRLSQRPQKSLAQIAAEIAECHDRLIGPHWERLRSVLDADIAYHAGLLAGGGARSLFSDLHPDFRWSARWRRDAGTGWHCAGAQRVHLARVVGEEGDKHPDRPVVSGPGSRDCVGRPGRVVRGCGAG